MQREIRTVKPNYLHWGLLLLVIVVSIVIAVASCAAR